MIVKLEELPALVAKIAAQLQAGDVLALSGPLASGKTTLTQQIMLAMGYTGKVTSPTFVLEKHYPVHHAGIREVVHLDFYRLKPEELATFGWQDYLGQPETLTIIEWPGVGLEHLPRQTKTIKLEIIDDQTRRFSFSDDFSF